MIEYRWVKGLVLRRWGRITGVASSVALLVALVSVLGCFVVFTRGDLARRAERRASLDWQVALVPPTPPDQALKELRRLVAPRAEAIVAYGSATNLEARTGQTVQTTGTAQVVGLPPGYSRAFPDQIRPLIGSRSGVLIAQQTAANLHVEPGDTVLLRLASNYVRQVRVQGVVDLPAADTFFQFAGNTFGKPQAPPDNVVLLPIDLWRVLYAPTGTGRLEIHARLGASLPPNPIGAFARLITLRRQYEAAVAGAAVVGDNLAGRLDAARTDAAYGQLLFLFLGLPGVALAIALAYLGEKAGAERRRIEQAVLRIRGANPRRLVSLAASEALLTALIGSAGGVATAFFLAHHLWQTTPAHALSWMGGAILAGLLASLAAVVEPAWRHARRLTVAQSSRVIPPNRPRPWRLALTLVLAFLAALTLWSTTRAAYQAVLAPEGVPTISIGYTSLAGPALLWLTGTVGVHWLTNALLLRGRPVIARLVHPLAGRLSNAVTSWLIRLRPIVSRAVLLLTLAAAFAVSTAIFNASFAAQARVDAELTNGSDVTVFAPPGIDVGTTRQAIMRMSGVRWAEPMEHRYAYVGNDLQDLFGIHPSTISRATDITDADFAGGKARDHLADLTRVADGIFVSEETMLDYQLRPGDFINIRLLDAQIHRYVPVRFRVLGVVREFPTAPTDSFLVANASFVDRKSHSRSRETMLIRTAHHPGAVSRAVRSIEPPGVQIRDIGTQQRLTESGLVAVDVRGLETVEVLFGGIALVWSVALLLSISLAERRRSLAILHVLGARAQHIVAFVLTEAAAVIVLGGLAGLGLGGAIGWSLVRLLRGVFDPPPRHPVVPWPTLGLLAAVAGLGLVGALWHSAHRTLRARAEELRDMSV